jgi:hypothetical protein
MSLDSARAVADAVLYEGYLLYPYRANSGKNQVRWQFGVLGPPGADAAGVGEAADLAVECLLRPGARPRVRVLVRFLQLQRRTVQRRDGADYVDVPELRLGTQSWLSWDEAVEHELEFGPFDLSDGLAEARPVDVAAGIEREPLADGVAEPAGRIVRERWPLHGLLRVGVVDDGEFVRLRVEGRNLGSAAADKDDAIRGSFIGTHLLLCAEDAAFLSAIDPPAAATAAAARCVQHRCWPVLAGPDDGADDIVLAAPIILYDYPQIAEQSAGALFDSTEIDEILTLRVMTLTDEEKAQARATDPHAAAIIDRCDQMAPAQMERLHGILRDPHAGTSMLTGDDWWQAEAAADVSPETDTVVVAGVAVGRGRLVRLHPSRRADAQDLFFAGQVARVAGVHADLDGETHVAVTLVDDPAAELHDWYGRYLYFAPDEIEPLDETVEPSVAGSESERRP